MSMPTRTEDERGLVGTAEQAEARDLPSQRPANAGGRARDLGLLAWQVRYEQRAFWRNRRRAIASFAFPLIFLVIFGGLFAKAKYGHHHFSLIDFYVPGMITYAVLVIGFTSTAMSIALLRSEGVLKRMRATPMPWTLYLIGIVLSTVLTIIVACALLLVIGVGFYKARMRAEAIPGLAVTLALGTICFTSFGIAVSRFIPKPDSGTPILMIIVLPLTFISNIFFRLEGKSFLVQVGEFFPLRRLAEGLEPAFLQAHGTGFMGKALVTLAIWSAVGCWVMVRAMRSLSAKE
jgi:ABC-2 type transport system permease protein